MITKKFRIINQKLYKRQHLARSKEFTQKTCHNRMRIVEIDLNKLPTAINIYDLSTDIGRSTYLKGVTSKNSAEVLIEGYIPEEAIKVIKK